MTFSAGRVFLRVCVVLALCVAGFFALQEPVRALESQAVAGLLHLAGVSGAQVVYETNVAIPADGAWLLASITPSCSALASVLALGCLVLAAPVGTPGRRAAAVLCAIVIVTVGNLLRMAASLGLGVVAGQDALVLFHDWIGGLCTFTYTLFGYVLFIYLMLRAPGAPGRGRSPRAALA